MKFTFAVMSDDQRDANILRTIEAAEAKYIEAYVDFRLNERNPKIRQDEKGALQARIAGIREGLKVLYADFHEVIARERERRAEAEAAEVAAAEASETDDAAESADLDEFEPPSFAGD